MIKSEKEIVSEFFKIVRSGKEIERASEFMAETVIAHQVQAEKEYSVTRSPQDYSDHVQEMLDEYGDFSLEVQEVLADGAKVYVRWRQIGESQKGKEIIEIASAVYLVENGKIVEYWIQIDRKGLELQLG
ncbi:ester cyclase [Listeria rustica]|uniref:SnoaL-like domain-containing protein n=1 Tax=Listeria rustica TaxID=2713503 RepID=A0A7W1T7C3_9LIST|nr:ester cyclase [Listeria rustica]MBA3926787.1 SnoaL-like domain-containing protein [Listeria rustica]